MPPKKTKVLKTKSALDALKSAEKSRNFFEFKDGFLVPKPGIRPTNQNTAKVQEKSRNALIKHVPDRKILRKITKRYERGVAKKIKLSKMNGGKGLHMAHVVSAKALATLEADMINLARHETDPAKRSEIIADLEEWATGHISSDAEDSEKEKIRTNLRKAATPGEDDASSSAHASHALLRLNPSSRNLVGGDGSTNSGIGQHEDEPLDRAGNPLPHTHKRVLAFWEIVGKYGLNSGGKYEEFRPRMVNGQQMRSTLPDDEVAAQSDDNDDASWSEEDALGPE